MDSGERGYSLYLGASSELPGLFLPGWMEYRVNSATYTYGGRARRRVFDGRTVLMSHALHRKVTRESRSGDSVDLGRSVVAIEDDYAVDEKVEGIIGESGWYRTDAEREAGSYADEQRQKARIRRLLSPGQQITDRDYVKIDSPKDVLVNWGSNHAEGHIDFLHTLGFRVVRKVHANDGVPISTDQGDLLTSKVDGLAAGVDDYHKLQGKLERAIEDGEINMLTYESVIEEAYRVVSETNGYFMFYVGKENKRDLDEGYADTLLKLRVRTMFQVAEQTGLIPRIILQVDPSLPGVRGKIYSKAAQFLDSAHEEVSGKS